MLNFFYFTTCLFVFRRKYIPYARHKRASNTATSQPSPIGVNGSVCVGGAMVLCLPFMLGEAVPSSAN